MNDHQLIWARCQNVHDMRAVAALDAQLREDGDPFTVMPTLIDGPTGVVGPPVGRRQIQTFLGLYEPALVLWVGGPIETTTLLTCDQTGIASIVLNSSAAMFNSLPHTWLPKRRRELFANLTGVLALDDAAAQTAIRAGVAPHRVQITGPLAETASILPYDEDDRSDFAATLGTRPVWLAAALSPESTLDVIRAHGEASRRAHRLLLIISPQSTDDIPLIHKLCVAHGFRTALRSETLEPSDDTQVYISDTPDELGLWHRISPISFMSGSFRGGVTADPFAAAALGSVVVHGPIDGPWRDQLQILQDAKATEYVAAPDALGKAIAGLLSPERTAKLVHAGWDVTTRGAMVLESLVTLVRETLEQKAT